MEDNSERLLFGVPDLPSHNLFCADPPPVLYHYSDANGLMGIVSSRALWLTKIQNLNDKSELETAISAFRSAISTFNTRLATEEDEYLQQVSNKLDSFAQTNICVSSFCEVGDLLSQWRGYGTHGQRFALGFSSKILELRIKGDSRLKLWKCVYSPRDQRQIISELVNLLLNAFRKVFHSSEHSVRNKNLETLTGYFMTLFLRIAPILKNENFAEEKEWRLITLPIANTDENFNVRVMARGLTEYLSLDFLTSDYNEFISDVVAGPSDRSRGDMSAVGVLLNRHNLRWKAIKYSAIPFRSN